jgi:hypothetical protein
MNITPGEAEESLETIQKMMQKTRHSIASGGTHITLIVTGIVWLVGFMCQQFLPKEMVGVIWIALSILGTVVGVVLGTRMGKRVRSASTASIVRRVALFWLVLIFFCIAAVAVAWPLDGKQMTTFSVLFIMIGQWAMGLLFSFAISWWALPVAALALVGYFLFPGIFYLWMALLGGGGMIILGVYLRARG